LQVAKAFSNEWVASRIDGLMDAPILFRESRRRSVIQLTC